MTSTPAAPTASAAHTALSHTRACNTSRRATTSASSRAAAPARITSRASAGFFVDAVAPAPTPARCARAAKRLNASNPTAPPLALTETFFACMAAI